jgi:3-dehydroquinate synthase
MSRFLQIDMAYSITLAHSRGLLNDAQRDEWFNLVSSVGLSMDHELFTEELLAASTEFIKLVPSPRSRCKVEYRD